MARMMKPQDEIDSEIIGIVRTMSKTHDRIYPWHIVPRLSIYRCEQTLRRDMLRLARKGHLLRMSERGGYWVAGDKAAMERQLELRIGRWLQVSSPAREAMYN